MQMLMNLVIGRGSNMNIDSNQLVLINVKKSEKIQTNTHHGFECVGPKANHPILAQMCSLES